MLEFATKAGTLKSLIHIGHRHNLEQYLLMIIACTISHAYYLTYQTLGNAVKKEKKPVVNLPRLAHKESFFLALKSIWSDLQQTWKPSYKHCTTSRLG